MYDQMPCRSIDVCHLSLLLVSFSVFFFIFLFVSVNYIYICAQLNMRVYKFVMLFFLSFVERYSHAPNEKGAREQESLRKPIINIHEFVLNEIPKNGNYKAWKQWLIYAIAIGWRWPHDDGAMRTWIRARKVSWSLLPPQQAFNSAVHKLNAV